MADAAAKRDKDTFEAYRLSGLAEVAHLIAAIFNSAGKMCDKQINPREIFDQLSGVITPPEDVTSDDAIGSLAMLKAERRAREEAERDGG